MFPITALIFAGLLFVFRIIYVIGYMKEPAYRLVGGIPVNLSNVILIIMSIVTCSIMAKDAYSV